MVIGFIHISERPKIQSVIQTPGGFFRHMNDPPLHKGGLKVIEKVFDLTRNGHPII